MIQVKVGTLNHSVKRVTEMDDFVTADDLLVMYYVYRGRSSVTVAMERVSVNQAQRKSSLKGVPF